MGKPVAPAFNGDDLGMMEKAVQNGCGRRHIPDEFAPFLDGAVSPTFADFGIEAQLS